MTVRQFLGVLRARWLLALAVLGAALAVATALSLLLPKQYTATASLLVDVKTVDPISGMQSSAVMMPSYMATQVDLIESDRIALRVVQALKLTSIPQMRSKWEEETSGAGNFDVWLADLLQRNLEVKPARESNVIQVSYKSPEPKFSAIVANGIARAYLDTLVELRVDPAKSFSSFFDQRSKQLLEAVERSQAKLSNYQRANGILGNEERLDVETLRLNELSAQVVALQGTSADSRSRAAAALGAPEQLGDVINNPVVAGLRSDLARLESRLLETSERLGERHPQVVELNANIKSMHAKLEEETQRLSGSVRVTNVINASRETQVRASLDAQRAKLLKLKAQRDELSVLQRELEHAQRAYDGVMTRLTQASLESLTPQSNALLLMAATEPPRHSSPRLGFNLALGAMAGLLLSIAAVFSREAFDRRIRSLDDVSHELGLPLLGTMLAPPRAGWRVRRPVSRPAVMRTRPELGATGATAA